MSPAWYTMSESTDVTGPISCWSFATPRVHYNLIDVFKSHPLTCPPSLLAVVGFKCPTSVPAKSREAAFWPFPRFAVAGDCHRLITCVEGHPRLISCGEDKVFDENTLTCEEDIPCRH